MGVKYLHYTSRQLAQEIYIAKRFRPRNRWGRIYFTQDTFASGAEAAAKLAIVNKPIEVCCIVPGEKIKEALENPENPKHVEPIVGPDGSDIRPGCSSEYFTKPGQKIEIDPDQAHWVSLSVP